MIGAAYFTTFLDDRVEAKVTDRDSPTVWFGVEFHSEELHVVDGTCARYHWWVTIGDTVHEGTDLRGPLTGTDPGAPAMFGSLCSFLAAGAEAYEWEQRNEGRSDNSDLFPEAVNAWAYAEDITIWELGRMAEEGEVSALECGCVPHETRMTGMGFTCVTEDQGYCNFECPHGEEE